MINSKSSYEKSFLLFIAGTFYVLYMCFHINCLVGTHLAQALHSLGLDGIGVRCPNEYNIFFCFLDDQK